MKIALPALSIAVLLFAASGMAFATPGQRAWREELRAMHQQQAWQDQEGRGSGREERGERQQTNNPQNGNAEGLKKPGKMSAEQRRALRRQINEAGRDIYAPGR